MYIKCVLYSKPEMLQLRKVVVNRCVVLFVPVVC